jgi:protein tyrosine phosphatase
MKLENIFVINKSQFDHTMMENKLNDSNVEKWDQYAFISIIDHTEEDLDFYSDLFKCSKTHFFKKDHKNVLNLEFDDIEDPQLGVPFDEDLAKKVINFLDKLPKTVNTIVIHCMAGISRSGGVGEFVSDYFGFDFNKFQKTNPQVKPNIRVRRILNNMAFRKNYEE